MIQDKHPEGGAFILSPSFLAGFHDKDLLTYDIA